MHILEQKIRAAVEEGRYAVIPFLTACYPDEDTFWQAMVEMDACGADVIEVGVPFSDPVADGPVVENASRQVLADGVTLKQIIEGLKLRKGFVQAGLVLMGYLNPFLQYGFEKLAADAAEAGVNGLIIPDLPVDEAKPYREALAAKGIALIALVGPNTSEERMKLYAEVSEGYTYVVSVMGVTGERSAVAPMVASTMERARRCFSIPLALGFGLSRPEQLDVLPESARPDAAVFGSALLTHLKNGHPVSEFMARWQK
ncbi:MAG: tryptophan synthase subunit alpha [Desulfovibrionaceae bacterium]|nr:tryptophan synthase subunit alpha [Desulfovibrionaceae bacterium]